MRCTATTLGILSAIALTVGVVLLVVLPQFRKTREEAFVE